ncbi:MAG: hypothetical protein COB53_05610 [Elusimicrobia bacterium]|nr:MAG: hypothetical protein COB53_05610 [Elusimicrobiota bacterium]
MAGKIKQFLQKHRTSSAAGGMVALAIAVIMWRSARPSNKREWVEEASALATADVDGDAVTVKNVRTYSWSENSPPTPGYETRSYDLRKLVSLDFILSQFGTRGLAGHTLLSFGFSGGEYLTLSVEIRRTQGQHYSFLRGLFRHYELIYVFADERDLVRLRTSIRKEETYLFPIKASIPVIRNLFLSVLKRANALAKNPEFYNSVKNSCTTNLIGHFNEVGLCRAYEYGPRAVFSGLSDGLLGDLGLIGDGTKMKEYRKQHKISERARAYGDGPDFSRKIRKR